jgi:hypothetical protein
VSPQLSKGDRIHPTHTVMKALRGIVVVAACGLAIGPERGAAQGRATMAVDATLGGSIGQGGEFLDRDIGSARLAASFRRSRPTRFGFFGELAIDAPSIRLSDSPVRCNPSEGRCLGSYPGLLGLTATGGLIAQRADRIEARLGVGGGRFIADPTGFRGTRVWATVTQADLTFFPVRHIGLIAAARWVAVPRYAGDQLSILPWAIGLRFR